MNKVRVWVAAAALAAVGLMVVEISRSTAAQEKGLVEGINKVAEALKKGDKAGAAKLAEGVAKKFELDEIMHAFKPRKKGGLGVGANPGTITPDGIEQNVQKLKRDVPPKADVDKNAEAYETMGYQVAALGEITRAKAPDSDKGKKTRKDWVAWSNDQTEAGLQLAKAAKSKGAQDIKTAADKVNTSCNACHSTFR
ncbi:MAG: hypothetical protein U0744_17005 [Gemmataceae bacterium]